MAVILRRFLFGVASATALCAAATANPADVYSAYRSRDWSLVEALASRFRDDADVLFMQGMASAHAGNLDYAITLLRRGISTSPSDARFALNAAAMLHSRGDWNGARALLEEYLAKDRHAGPVFRVLRDIINRAAQEHYARALGRDALPSAPLPLIEPSAPVAKPVATAEKDTAGDRGDCSACVAGGVGWSSPALMAAQWGVPSPRGSAVFLLGAGPLGTARMEDSFTAAFSIHSGIPTGARGYSPVWTGGWLHTEASSRADLVAPTLWQDMRPIGGRISPELTAGIPPIAPAQPRSAVPPPVDMATKPQRTTPAPIAEGRRARESSGIEVPASLLSAMSAWSAAWSSRRVDAYLSLYGPDFLSRPDEARAAWAARRRTALLRAGPIQLEVHMLRAEADTAGDFTIHFRQLYRTSEVGFDSTKVLRWRKYEENWLIVSETVEKELRTH